MCQTCDETGGREEGQDRREHHHHDLGRDEGLPLGQDVGEDAGEQAKDHDRQELRGGHDAQPQGIAAGDRQHEPRLRDLLHPRADERDRLAGEEEPVVSVAERGHRLRAHDVARRQGGRAGHRRDPRAGRGPGCGPPPGCGSGPPSRLARCSSRWRRRPRASAIIAVEAGTLGDERLDLPIDPRGRVLEQRASLGLVAGRPEPLSIALARGLVLEQLADLGEREPGVVAQGADEAQALEVGCVEQAVGAVRPGGGLQEAHLFVVADRAGRQAGLGGDILDPEEGGFGGGRGGREGLRGHPANDTTTFTFT